MASQSGSPLPKKEVETPSRSEGRSMHHSSRAGQQNGEESSKVDEPYAQLIHRAFMSRDRHAMTLQEIYQWVRENTEKGKSDDKGWQNSIRHNLSMNRHVWDGCVKLLPNEILEAIPDQGFEFGPFLLGFPSDQT